MQASDQNSVRLERVDIERSLDRALESLADAIASSRATIRRSPLPMVIGNEVLLAQVFQNLISNALKYRSERPLEVHISGETSGPECTFSIRDNGIGIAPEYHERIFGVFKRLHRDEYPGTGIGLAICKGVVERLGGRIWVESELGVGADFRFALRAAEN
jgi:chemotaxis family two-component system sensor kinase Cph1